MARRPALVFTAATLVALTAACGPGDLSALGAGAAAPVAAEAGAQSASGAGEQVPAVPVVPPVEETPAPAPAPVPPVEEPVETLPEPTAETEPVAEPTTEQAPAEPVTEAADKVRTHAAAPKHQGSRSRSGGSGRQSTDTRSTDTRSAGAPAASAPAAAAPAPAAAAGAASGGSGGSFADQQRTKFTAANGQSGQYLRYAAGVDPSRPVGLVVYVDGTGEYGVDNPNASYALGGSSGLVAVAKARNMITLAVESPNQSCECWHSGDTAAYADFLADLIEQQYGSYPIGEIWLAGFSSGAQEITRFLVPRHPELMRVGGGWVVFGGGGPPAGSSSAVSADRMAGVRGHWFTGTADTAVPLTASWGARAGESWYAARGVRATSEYPSGVDHGLFGRLGSTVARMIDAG
ncbi:hypothetical protein [Modestobacter lapidis]|nr:hypothetical protein [Modestobacter lapidis]